jgi:transcriptional regulator with PAS, ATPase and Fis domain
MQPEEISAFAVSSPAPEARAAAMPAHQYEWAFANSAAMRRVKSMIERVAPTNATVLVWGESGVGKELVARAVHHYSPRRNRPFVKINSAALPSELLESELFGYERGAFTGAHRPKPGKFELATTGTVFLDEIGEMPLSLQAKLLNILEDREVSRLGSQRNVRIDVRVTVATNKNLAALVEQGLFRDDLYYRLNVMSIYVPPLRERAEEIPILIDRLVGDYAAQYECPRPRIRPETMRLMLEYSWPGNVRELENWVKRIVVLQSDDWVAQAVASASTKRDRTASAIAPVEAPAAPSGNANTNGHGHGHGHANGHGHTTTIESAAGLKEIGRRAALQAEAQALREVLDSVHWHRLEAARRLKVSYKTLLQKMKQCGL